MTKTYTSLRKCILLLLSVCTAALAMAQVTYTDASGGPIPTTGTAGPALFTINVPPGTGAVTSFDNVTLDLNHSWVSDLDIFLESPSGTRVELTTDNGGAGDNYSITVFEDGAATPITAGTAPFNGTFAPEGVLADFLGETADGTWILDINDTAGGDSGAMTEWSMTFASAIPMCTITCPADITVNADPGTCDATVTIPDPILDASCVGTTITQRFDGATETLGVDGATTFTITGVPATLPAGAASVDLEFNYQGDIDGARFGFNDETLDITLEGVGIGFLGGQGIQCGAASNTITITAAQYTAAAADGVLTFTTAANANVNENLCGTNEVSASAIIPISVVPFGNSITGPGSVTNQTFPVGTTPVTFFTQDATGATISCTMNVTVVDAEAPVFTNCPTDQVFNLNGGECDVLFTYDPVAEDNCFGGAGPIFLNLTNANDTLTATDALRSVGPIRTVANVYDFTATTEELSLQTLGVFIEGTSFTAPLGVPEDLEVSVYELAPGYTLGTNPDIATATLLSNQLVTLPAGVGQGIVDIPLGTLIPASANFIFVVVGDLGLSGGNFPLGLNNSGSTIPSYTNVGTGPFTPIAGFAGNVAPFVLRLAQTAVPVVQTAGPDASMGVALPIGVTTFSYTATDASGNTSVCSFDVTVNEFVPTGGGITINPTVQTSLDPSGACTIVSTDELLEGNNYGCYDNFIITRTPAVAPGFGCPTGPNYLGGVPVTCADIGRPVRVVVTDPNTGNSQWATIIVEDKTAPVFANCLDFTVGCNFDVTSSTIPAGTQELSFPGGGAINSANPTTSVTATLNAPPAVTITSVELDIDITHTWVGDLDIELVAPDGTALVVLPQSCGNTDDILATFADDGLPQPQCGPGTPVITGRVAPQDPFAALIGLPAAGDYTVNVTDNVGGDVGVLNGATLRIGTSAASALPVATDNCPGVTVTTTSSIDNADCAGDGTVIRTFVATDASGNTATCSQTITIELPELADVEFPANLDGISGPMLECTSAYPAIGARVSLTETRTFTPGTAIVNGGSIQIPVVVTGFPADAQIEDLDISLDIAYSTSGDLIIDYGRQFDANPTSLLANVCDGGNDILATLDDAGFAQYDCATFDPSLKGTFQPNGSLADFNGESPNGTFFLYVEDFDGTNFDFGSVDGITLSVTYSTATLITAPTIGGLPFDQLDCQINMTMDDTVIDVCPTSYKVRRRFTVINMCTGEDIIVNQIIAVQDQDAPIVACPRSELDNPIDLVALSNQGYQNPTSGYGVCLGDIVVPPVTVLSDNCSGVGSVTTELFAADGTQIGSVSGNGGTFRELPLDDGIFTGALNEPSIRYSVRYIVEDNCNNQETVEVFYNVVERTAPVANCDEITNVSLTGTDTTFVNASVFDDGSYDICSDIHFYVRRMQPTNDLVAYGNYFESIRLKTFVPFKFRERVAFTCDDQNVMLYFLVVDDFVQGYIDEYVNVIIPGLPAAVRNNPNTPYTIWPDGTFYLSTFPGIGGETKDIWQGHYNICMVDVEVEDKVAPVKLLDAPDRTIVCTNDALRQQYLDDQNVTFDAPIFQDNCDFTVSLQIIDGTTTCGDGTIRRRFQATDVNGNMSILCEQRITSVLEHDYTILWPRDEDRNMCVAGVLGDTLSRPNSLIEDGCDLLAVSYVDARFQTNDDACYKILRTYDVINWCEWDGVANAILIPNSTFTTQGPRLDVVISQAGAQNVQINFNPSTIRSVGRWSYVQQIKVYDEEDPTLGTITQAPCEAGNVVDDVAGFGCGQAVSVNFELTDNCGGLTPPTYRLVAFTGDVNGDGQISAAELANGTSFANDPFAGVLSAPAGSTSSVAQSGTFTITGTYPLGDHVFVVSVTDLCGNAAEYYIPFTAEDCKEPTPKAISFITIDLMATGMVPCTPAHIDNGSFDGCGPVKLSFSADVNDTLAVFTCADLGTNPVQLWVTDAAGNQDFVDVDIIIQDNLNACGTSTTPRIAASLTTAGGVGVQGATVNLSGDATMSDATDVNGVTGFDVTAGGDYTVSALLDSDPANGVTTYDLYLIGQHILGVTDLTTFSQLTAADANANGSVSAFDMTVIRRVILGLDQNFRNNTSWRFFDANDNTSEVVSFNDIQAQVAADFIAVKTGDVNATARANSRQALAPRTLVGEFALVANDAVLAAGETQVVSFNASEAALGYQLTLEWDANALEVVSVNGGAHNAADFGKHLLANGKLTMSHNGSMEGELFSLEVRALRDGVALSEVMSAGSSVTTAEAYGTEGTKSVALRFGGSVAGAGNALEQNRPNPFAGTTQIGFTLAEAGAASLIVTDVTGRVVWRTAGQFDAGHSQVEIAAGDLPAAGLLNYTLIAGDFTATRKMVVIK